MDPHDRQARLLAEMGIRHWAPGRAGSQGEAPQPGAPQDRPVRALAGEAGAPDPGAQRLARPPEPALALSPPAAGPLASSGRDRDGDAGHLAVDALDWPALRAAVTACTACGLCGSRNNAVFGIGHPRAHLMVVGEAPGEQEDRQGEPFVGKAGQLLDNMLRALGLGRGTTGDEAAGAAAEGDPARQVFIANVLKCRPPMNRNPLPEEMARCEPYLQRQIALVRPRVILAMGRFAVQSLLRSDAAIGQLRGRLHAYQGVPLVVTYHPAYLLRNPVDKARAWDDLCLARTALQGAGR